MKELLSLLSSSSECRQQLQAEGGGHRSPGGQNQPDVGDGEAAGEQVRRLQVCRFDVTLSQHKPLTFLSLPPHRVRSHPFVSSFVRLHAQRQTFGEAGQKSEHFSREAPAAEAVAAAAAAGVAAQSCPPPG